MIQLLLLFAACSWPAAVPSAPAPTPVAVDAPLVENAKRPPAPRLITLTEYKTSPENLEGTLMHVTTFNDKGLKVRFETYDYYGSGSLEGASTWEYDEAGRAIQRKDADGMVTTFTYAGDKVATETWARGADGATEQNTYDAKGRCIETRYLKSDGALDYRRTWEFVDDANGKTLEEKKWEKYTDGTADMLAYHARNKLDVHGRILATESLSESGEVTDEKRFVYDDHSNAIEEQSWSHGVMTQKDVNAYNEFGELVRSQAFSCDEQGENCSVWATYTWERDAWGNKTAGMTAQANDADFGERFVYEYAK